MTRDDWSRNGEPHEWWDRYSIEPMLSFPRFDLSESSYALLFMANRTPAWREVYIQILDKLIERHTTYWAAVDWLSQIGPDPRRASYPDRYKGLIPKHLWGDYDVPGWTANGVEPWGLQPDPIGADGMLFFRGFLNLMLGIHRAVSGADTWNKPFAMTGLEDRVFEWTHERITERLEQQWTERPEGPHCENTKVWPFCLSAAGLGMMLADHTLGTKSHWVYPRWIEDVFLKRLMEFGPNGEIKSAPFYFDPIRNFVHRKVPLANLGTALYMLPQNRPLAQAMYERAVSSVLFNKPYAPVYPLRKDQVRNYTMAYLMALEFGDDTTARRMRTALQRRAEPRWFGEDTDEFGYFFEYGEPWPRGQESALLMVADYIGEGTWSGAFSSFDEQRFSEPSVIEVDFPRLGIDEAWNDPERGALQIRTYAATTSAQGEPSKFKVTNLPSAGEVEILRDGRSFGGWQVIDDSTIAINSRVGRHRFDIRTGYRRSRAPAASPQRGANRLAAAAGSQAHSADQHRRIGFGDLVVVGRQLASGAPACPCCGS